MATLFTDDFNRANSGTVSAANWTEMDDGSLRICSIVSNQLSLDFGSGSNPCYVYTTTTAHAAIADCRASVTRITTTGWDGGPLVRRQSGADTYYYLDVIVSASSHSVFRVVANSHTDLGTRSFTSTTGDVLGIEASGTGATVTLKVYKNGAQQGTDYSDTNAARITGAGQTGAISWGADLIFDDFLAEDLAGGGGGGNRRRRVICGAAA